MTSPHGVLLGAREPRVLLRPQWDDQSEADDAIALGEACGQHLDPWQKLLVRITLATHHGQLAASTVGALVARQNGKGAWLETIALWSLFLSGGTTMWTSHELKTNDVSHARLVWLIKSSPDLNAEVLRYDGGLTGQHVITLRNGAEVVFVARSKGSGRGFSPRRIIYDEAQQLSALTHRALMFSTAAQGLHRQLIYTGTVPGESMDSTIFTGIRDRGRAGDPNAVAWAEWSPAGSDDPNAVIDPESWENREAANPGIDVRITRATIDDEWNASKDLDPLGFMQERISVWPSPDPAGVSRVIVMDDWESCPQLEPPGRPPAVLALEVSLDRTQAWLLMISARSDGRPQVEVLPTSRDGEEFTFSGTAAIPTRVAQIWADDPDVAALAVDRYGNAMSLTPAITAAARELASSKHLDRQLAIVDVDGPQFVSASGQVEDAIRLHDIGHGASALLELAVRAADVAERDGVRFFRRSKSGPAAGPFFAMLVGLHVWRASTVQDEPVQPFAFWG